MSTAAHAKLIRDEKRRKELERCRKSLWYLATRVLSYGWNEDGTGAFPGRGLTWRLHKPLCDWYDRNRTEPLMGLWMARSAHKTTLTVCQIIQDWLIDPTTTILYWHAVDQEAENVLGEIVKLVRGSKALRALDPVGVDDEGTEYNIFPRGNATRWYRADRIQLKHHRVVRFPSLTARGAGSEVTGAHGDKAYLDDIISRKTIENSELPKVKSWFENTVMPVVDGATFRVTGTPWSAEGLYTEWMESKSWRTCVVPGSTNIEDLDQRLKSEFKVHFPPDYSLENPIFGPDEYKRTAKRYLEFRKREMKGEFAPQIMIDPSPQSERPWNQDECENYTSIKKQGDMPGIAGDGRLFVLSDPAPFLQGSYKGLTEKQRGDGTKDFWSICVVKLRNRGDQQDIILLDGARSQEWGHQAGNDRAMELAKKWRLKTAQTPIVISEAADEHWPYLVKASRRIGVTLTQDRRGGPVKFSEYNKRDGKNARFARLAERAKIGEFWISSETVPKGYLHGDGNHTGFLTQARKWTRVSIGYNSLRYDDDADVVSRATDETLLQFSPLPVQLGEESFLFEETEGEHEIMRSKYCGV